MFLALVRVFVLDLFWPHYGHSIADGFFGLLKRLVFAAMEKGTFVTVFSFDGVVCEILPALINWFASCRCLSIRTLRLKRSPNCTMPISRREA